MFLNYIITLNTTSIIHYVHCHQSSVISPITESLRFLHNSPRSGCHISSGRTLFNVSFMHVFPRRFVQSFPTDRLCSCSRYLFVFFRFRNLKKMSSIPSKSTTIGSANMIRSWRFIHINYNGGRTESFGYRGCNAFAERS